MDEKLFFIFLAIVAFVFIGPLRISNIRVGGGEQYRRENLRYTTPGRNQRQLQLARDRKDRKMGQSQSQDTQETPAATQKAVVVDPDVVAKREEVCLPDL